MNVTNRLIQETDEPLLETSLSNDEYHKNTDLSFFKQDGTVTKVYELEGKPVIFARCCKSLRLDLQFVDNKATKKNIVVMLKGFPELVEQAKQSGYREIVFNTSSKVLQDFCTKYLDFQLVDGVELRRSI